MEEAQSGLMCLSQGTLEPPELEEAGPWERAGPCGALTWTCGPQEREDSPPHLSCPRGPFEQRPWKQIHLPAVRQAHRDITWTELVPLAAMVPAYGSCPAKAPSEG